MTIANATIRQKIFPVHKSGERHTILDVLRGFALLGIVVANYAMFSLYIFQGSEKWEIMPTATLDKAWGAIHFMFIDGKFYTLFSLLFGISFSIILTHAENKGKNGLPIFYRRLIVLLLIGLAHLLFLWEGDIVMLYALLGLALPLFRNVSNRNLIILSTCLILFPILIDLAKVLTDNRSNPANLLAPLGKAIDNELGITDKNFATWLVDHTSYKELLDYNRAGMVYRYMGLLDNNRLLKVFGIFLLGLYAGRNRIYANLEENKVLLKKILCYGFLIGLPFSILHTWLEINGNRLPAIEGWYNSIAYALSVVPLGLAYAATICLWFLKNPQTKLLQFFVAPGRMALTNYIFQTICAIAIFYGVGLGLGANMGLIYVMAIAVMVYIILAVFSHFWLRYFNYGPLEWIWRMLTYGKYLRLRKFNLTKLSSV